MTRKKFKYICQTVNIEIQTIPKFLPKKALSIFHMNVCSLTKNFDNFNIQLSFDIIVITESRIMKDSSSQINL